VISSGKMTFTKLVSDSRRPVPSCPASPAPVIQSSPRKVRIAVCRLPQLTWLARVVGLSGTFTGAHCVPVVARPSAPYSPKPQVYSAPSSNTTAVCPYPQLIRLAGILVSTSTKHGEELNFNARSPTPSLPSALLPIV
jgi:hypothetical protein